MKKKGVYKVIYCIKNILSGKVYVGSANRYNERRRQHTNALNRGDHCNRYLQQSWIKYGEKAFVFGVIEELTESDSLAEKEQFWMNFFNVCDKDKGYNIMPHARSNLGHSVSEETKKKMSLKKKGKTWSENQRKAMMGAHPKSRPWAKGSNTKLSRPILQFDLNGTFIKKWESINMAAVALNIHKPNIVAHLKNRIKQTEGHIFKYSMV